MIKLREEFNKGLFWTVGNGLSISIWKDNWLTGGKATTFALPNVDTSSDIKVNSLISNQQWDRNKIERLFNYRGLQQIQKIKLPYNNISDKLVWSSDRNGNFSTRSAYELISNNKTPRIDYHSWIWKLNTYPKIKNFLWRLSHNGLPTKMKLYQKNIVIPLSCNACQNPEEDVKHLFFQCPFTINQIYEQDPVTLGYIRNINLNNEQIKTILLDLSSTMPKEKIIILATTWWAIWYFRNQNLFLTNPTEKIQNLPRFIKTLRLNWGKTRNLNKEPTENIHTLKKQPPRKKRNIHWVKPDVHKFKVNFDGAVNTNGNSAMGFIIRDHSGRPVFMDHESGTNLSVLQTEALALRAAIRKVKELNLSLVEIKGDNLCLINVLKGIWCCPWDVDPIVSDIRFELSNCPGFHFSHVFREINQVADCIAKLGFLQDRSDWRDDLELSALIRNDALG